jgi:hypothetical protein
MVDDEDAASGLADCGVAGVWIIFGGSGGGPKLLVVLIRDSAGSGEGSLRELLSELLCRWWEESEGRRSGPETTSGEGAVRGGVLCPVKNLCILEDVEVEEVAVLLTLALTGRLDGGVGLSGREFG